MNNNIIAKLKINIGLGKNNPFLNIHPNDDISALVRQLVNRYSLPKRVYEEIMNKVMQEFGGDLKSLKYKCSQNRSIKRNSSHKQFFKERGLNRSPIVSKRSSKQKSVSVQNKNQRLSKTPKKQKTPVKKLANLATSQRSKGKSFDRHTVTSANKMTAPLQKEKENNNRTNNIQKASAKTQKNKKNPFEKIVSPRNKLNYEQNIRSVFRYLTSQNATNDGILYPQNICLTGLSRNFLGQLQLFFELLEENTFQNMNEDVFLFKVNQLGYTKKLGGSQLR